MPHFIVLCFIACHRCRFLVFSKSKARPCASRKVTARLTTQWSGTEPAASPRSACAQAESVFHMS